MDSNDTRRIWFALSAGAKPDPAASVDETTSLSRRLGAFADARLWIVGLAVMIVIYLAGVPLGMLLWGSFKQGSPVEAGPLTLANYRHAFGDATAYTLLFNSVLYAAGSTLLALTLGTTIAFVIERTNTPFKSLLSALVLIPLVIPGILHTISWILLLSPRIGVLNQLLMATLGLEEAPFDIYGMGGMIWVQGLRLSPLVFLLMVAAFRSMDPALEEAALASGATYAGMVRRVTLPLAAPAMAAVSLIMFIRGLESFEVPALIGLRGDVRVFTSRIWLALREFPPDYGQAAAFAVGLAVISAIGIGIYSRMTTDRKTYATVTGRGFKAHVIELGPWRYVIGGLILVYFALLVGLPFLILLWTSLMPSYVTPGLDELGRLSLDNYAFILKMDRMHRALFNSMMLSFGSALIVMLLTALIAWITVKSRWKGRRLLDSVTFLPITIPGIVLGVSLLWLYLTLPIPIYGTLWILLIAYVTRYLPYGFRANSASMVQIHDELEEAAAMSGGSWLQTFRRVTLPLLRPGLLAGFIYIFIAAFDEFSSSVLLYSSKSMVLSILIFDLWDGGQFTIVAALSVILMGFLVALVALALRLGSQFGPRIE